MNHIPMRSSVMIKLIAAFFLALLPVTLLYISSYQMSRTLLTNEIIDSIQRQNQDFSDRISDDLQRILSTNRMLSTNWELGKLAVVPDDLSAFQKSVAISNIQDKIYLAQLTSRFIESIDVYIPEMDKCISTNQSSSSLEKMRRLSKEIDQIPLNQFIIRGDKIVLVAQNTFILDKGPSLIIHTTLSSNSMNDILRSSPTNMTQSLLFSINNLEILSTQNKDVPEAPQLVQVIAQELKGVNSPIPTGTMDATVSGVSYKIFYTFLRYGDVVLVRYLNPSQIHVNFGNMQFLMTLFIIIFAISFLLLYLSLHRLVNTPLRQLMKAFDQVMQGDFEVSIQVHSQSEFKSIYEGFNRMVSRIKELINQTYQQTIYLQRAELKHLQAQIDPHFLYNSFFILNKRIRVGDTSGALSFSYAIAEYFRYVTQNAHDTMPLLSEVEHAYNYANIQQVRFSNRLTLSLENLPEQYNNVQVPRLILQPIFENVFRHVLDKEYAPMKLQTSYQSSPDTLIINIEDSGQSLKEEVIEALSEKLNALGSMGEISGLVNVHKRLRIFYGDSYGLSVQRSGMGGLQVTLKIHLEENKSYEKPTDC